MAQIMLQLGDYQFGVDTAAYQELRRVTGYRWAAQERIGQRAALQFTGPDSETITLPGTVYPAFNGGVRQIDNMRAEAAKGQPLDLVSGEGDVLGRWVILRVEETQSVFVPGGLPRKQEFSIELRAYDEGI